MMGFLRKTAPYQPPHSCDLPGGSTPQKHGLKFGLGTIWQCEECGKHFELRHSATYRMNFQWYSVSARQAHRTTARAARKDL